MNFATKAYSLRLSLKYGRQLNDLKACGSINLILNPVNRGLTRNFSQFQTKSNVQSVILSHAKRESFLPVAAIASIMVKRWISVQEVTKNIELYTAEPRQFQKDAATLRLTQNSEDKPLVLILAWLQAKQKHLKKYSKLYIDQGFDVLCVRITPWQLLWPAKGTQQVAGDIVQFLAINDYYKQVVLNGFSVGGYMWGECLAIMKQDMDKYQQVVDRIVAQVWDSAADITEIPVGVPKALFPRNPRLQNALRNYMKYHMKTFHEAATQHYIRSSQMFHTNFAHAPALFIISKTDPVGAEASNRRVADSWISNGIKVTWKCFDRSPHVGHFLKHREAYIQYLHDHLQAVNMVKYPEALRAKL